MLELLEADRANLAARMRVPRWLPLASGVVMAGMILTPLIGSELWRNTVFVVLAVVTFGLQSAYDRSTGVKLGRLGWRAWAIYGVALVGSLAMLSVSFGLVGAGLHGWTVVPALVGFGLVFWLIPRFYAAAGDELRHAR